jgi:nicotinic acid mononucleotide adenylyltransferase
MCQALTYEVTRAKPYLKRTDSSPYMVDFIAHLRESFPVYQYTLIMGSDEWGNRHKWHHWEELEKMLEGVFVIPRDGTLTPSSSSTRVKHNLGQGVSVKGLIPKAVLDIIKREGLYGTTKEEK